MRLEDLRGWMRGEDCPTSSKGLPRDYRIPLAARFWAKVTVAGDDECWLWTGAATPQGYGHIREGGRHGKTLIAPRVSWELHNGAVPAGKYVLHRCDTPRCVNPAHLFLGTHADNMADCRAKGRGRSVRGEKHYAARVNRRAVRRLIRNREGWTQRRWAAELGISKTQVGRIQRGESWGWM